MISFLNRKLRSFLFIILVLVAVSFIFIDITPSSFKGSRNLGEIQGEGVSRADFGKFYREAELSFTLTTGQLISRFPGAQDLLLRETWNRLITLKAAKKAGINISANEITEYITLHPIFQEQGKFSPKRFQQFAAAFFDPQGVLTPEGMNLERFESTIRNQLMIEKFNQMIQASAVATDEEVISLIERLHGHCTIKVATLSREDVAKDVTIDDKELEAFYQQNLARYMTPEKRRINYVYFQLPAESPSEGKERELLLRQLGESAFHFSEPFYQAQQDQKSLPVFSQEARKAQLTVKSSGYFSAAEPPSEINGGARIVQAAFALSDEDAVSDAIQVDDGFVILQISGTQESVPVPFAVAAKTIRDDYQQQEIERRFAVEGRQLALKIRDLVADGESWNHAVKEAGFQEVEDVTLVPSLEMRGQGEDKIKPLAARSASAMEAGEISPFERVGDVGYVFYIANREAPAAEIMTNHREATQQQLIAQKGAMLVREWVKNQYTAPGTDLPLNQESL